MVLLVGQYSVGKTSFIRYLLGRDFPGQHIGPEPTTDRFIAVMHGQDDKTTPGNALAVSPNMPFRGLEMFGNGFLSKFQGAQLDVPLLHHVTLIDTPGILSGEKQRSASRPLDRAASAGAIACRRVPPARTKRPTGRAPPPQSAAPTSSPTSASGSPRAATSSSSSSTRTSWTSPMSSR